MPGLSTRMPPPGEEDELAARRRVTSGAVAATSCPLRVALLADSALTSVDLPDAGRAEQGTRPARAEHPRAPRRARGLSAPTRCDIGTSPPTSSTSAATASGSLSRSAFVSKTHGPCAALHGEREVALEEPRVEVLAERVDDEHDVDVRRDDLLAARRRMRARARRGARSSFAGSTASTIGAGSVERDPVADDRQPHAIGLASAGGS